MHEINVPAVSWNRHFRQIADRLADKAAVTAGGRSITYGELDIASDRIGSALLQMGAGPGTRTALVMENSIEAVTAVLGVIKAGGAYVPVNPKDAAERQRQIIRNSGCRALLTGGDGIAVPYVEDVRTIELERLNMDTAVGTAELPDFSGADSAAYLLYTSGSTGVPKGAVITHGNICSQMAGITAAYNLKPDDVWTQFHTLCFDFSVLEIFGCLYSGGTLVIVPETLKCDGEAFLHYLSEQAVTVLGLVPSVMYRMPVSRSVDRLFVRLLILGGEKLTFSKLRAWFDRLPRLEAVNGYGLTETTVFNMGKLVTADTLDGESESIGRPFPPNRVRIISDSRCLGVGEVGEICLSGPAISPGYWQMPELNQEKFIRPADADGERYFRTGDLGRLTPSGEIEFVGRADYQIKLRGFRVEPEAVEHCLMGCPGVRHAAVKPDETGQQLLGFIVSDPEIGIERLRSFAAAHLPAYMIPTRWILLDEMPLTDRGKADKSRLYAEGRSGCAQAFSACETETERALRDIWASDFPDAEIGADDSYYELGGHSLLVVNMLNRVAHCLGVQIPLTDFMADPVIRSLARTVDAARSGRADPSGPGQSEWPDSQCAAAPADLGETLSSDSSAGYPMTDLQQAFFIGRASDVALGNCASHSYAEIECEDYDAARFERVLRILAARHEMLRCRFDEWGNHHIEPDICCVFPTHDLTGLTVAARDAALFEIRDRMENMVLDPGTAPLARVEVSLTGGGRARIHLYVDALIGDGWSHERLLYEADQLYTGAVRSYPPMNWHFSDYVAAGERLKHTPCYAAARQFWMTRVRDLPDNPGLPADEQAVRGKPIRSEQKRRLIANSVWDQACLAARQMGVSSFVVALTAFCRTIARYSRNQRFVINLPVSNRPPLHPEVDQAVGVYSNFFLFDYENRPGETLAETAVRVQRSMWELKAHEAFNGNEIIRELYRASGQVAGFVASIVFTSLLDMPFPEKKVLRRVYLETHTSQIWMDTVLMRDEDGISINCDYVSGLLSPELVDRVMSGCAWLIEALAADRSSWSRLTAPPLTHCEQAARDRFRWVCGPLPEQSVTRLFENTVSRCPDAPMIMTPSLTLSYREAAERIDRIRQAMGPVRKGAAVAVCSGKAWYQAAAILAVLASGGFYVPIDETFPDAAIRHCLSVSGASICLTDTARLPGLAAIPNIRAIDVETLDYDLPPVLSGPVPPPVPSDPDDQMAIIFTSGTTGQPKGICLKQAGILNSVLFTNRRYGVCGRDRALALTSICHDMSMYDLFGMIAAGGAIIIPEREGSRDPACWLRLIRQFSVTVFNAVPSFAEMLFLHDPQAAVCAESIRLVIHGGDFLKPELARRWLGSRKGLQLVNVGGPTETSLWSIYHDVTAAEAAAGAIPYGRPIDNMCHYVLNDRMEEAPQGVSGVICSSGIGLADGYAGLPELTDQKFIIWNGRRLFVTGDIGYVRPDGEIMICGRDDNQIKIQGKRIEPEEIEHQADSIDGVSGSCAVLHLEKKKLVLYYTGAHAPEPDDLKTALRSRLPEYMVPPLCIRTMCLPYTRNGKPDRRALSKQPLPAANVSETSRTLLAGADPVLTALCAAAASLLDVPELLPDDNFFMAGGNSILAVRLLAFIRRRFGIQVGLGAIFENPCPRDWADLIAAGSDETEAAGVPIYDSDAGGKPLSAESRIPLSSAQSGIWFYETLSGGSRYIICAHMRIEGALDTGRLRAAVESVVERHAVFRLNVRTDEQGQPYQFFNAGRPAADISMCAAGDAAAVSTAIHRASETCFRSDVDPLCRICLMTVSPVLSHLILTLHHLVTDETSIECLAAEIVDRYAGRADAVAADGGTYTNYCIRKSRALCPVDVWAPVLSAVPEDRLRAAAVRAAARTAGAVSGSTAFVIGAGTESALRSLCRRRGCTLYNAFLACFTAALYLYTGDAVLPVVSAFSDRSAADAADAQGMFVCNQCLVCQTCPDQTFEDLLDDVCRQTQRIYSLPMFSLNDIVRAAGLPSAYLALQDHIVFTCADNDRRALAEDGLSISPVEIVKKTNTADLHLLIERVGGQLKGSLNSDRQYMTDQAAAELVGVFLRLCDRAAVLAGERLVDLIEVQRDDSEDSADICGIWADPDALFDWPAERNERDGCE